MQPNNTSQTPSKVIDINELTTKTWSSPENHRVDRSSQGLCKVRSIRRGRLPLRGGDFLLNQHCEAATVSFCFYKDNQKLGLSVAHLFRKVGDRVYALDADTPDDNGAYDIVEIGEVVSMDANTDSMVFKLKDEVGIDPLCLPPEAGLQGPLEIPDWDSLPPLQLGTTLVGFGAQRRGAVGVVVGTWKESISGKKLPILDVDIFMASGPPDSGNKQLSDDGDCGTLFLDEKGIPWYMHHVPTGTELAPVTFGVPLRAVMESHPRFFGGLVPHLGTVASHPSLGGPSMNAKKTALVGPEEPGVAAKNPNGDTSFNVAPVKQFKGKLVELDKPFDFVVTPVAQFKAKVVDLFQD